MPIIDPFKIDPVTTPTIVLLDNLQGFIPFLIKSHEKGNYSHIMWLLNDGKCASQDPQGYRIRDISEFMFPKYRMKFFKIKDDVSRMAIYDKVSTDLESNKGKMYDFLGIIGQALRLPWIQNPWKKFCSERVAEDLRVCYNCKDLKAEPSPADLNTYFINRPLKFELLGHWFCD